MAFLPVDRNDGDLARPPRLDEIPEFPELGITRRSTTGKECDQDRPAVEGVGADAGIKRNAVLGGDLCGSGAGAEQCDGGDHHQEYQCGP